MFTVSTETTLSPTPFNAPAGNAKSALPVVELPRKTPFSHAENACAPPLTSDCTWMPVSAPLARKRPRYQVLPVWKPYSSANRTGSEPGAVVLCEDILSAVTQLESLKPGCASGVSSLCFHPVSAGNTTACAAPTSPIAPPKGSGEDT